MSSEIVANLITTIKAVASAVSFECDVTNRPSGMIPMSAELDDNGDKPTFGYHMGNAEVGQGKHHVQDILIYPRKDFDYVAEHSRTVGELNIEAITKIGAEILRPLVQARQIDATARSFTAPDGRSGTFIRVFRASDYPCSEHPEMLLGQPLGQYHCPACGEMQMAGCFHLPREFDDEGNPTNQQ